MNRTELREKINHIETRLVNCSQKHQRKDSPWVDGVCITPSTAVSEILHLIDEWTAGVIGEDTKPFDWTKNRGMKPDIMTPELNKLRAEQRRRAGIGEK